MAEEKKYPWEKANDEELLQWRIRDLNLSLEGTAVEEQIRGLYGELEGKNLPFRPVCYLADEWFVPEGDTVIGLPFFLVHPRLRELERKMILEVEGEQPRDFMRLIRHETGHALFYAYGLRKNRIIRKTFEMGSGNSGAPFRPRPYSKNYVLHLDNWYAQTDPDEDFAETFAVWLNPDSRWETEYQGWKCLGKLRAVDAVMKHLAGRTPPHLTRDFPYAAATMGKKLATYYRERRALFAEDYPDFYDRDLMRIFPSGDAPGVKTPAWKWMQTHRRTLVGKVSHWTHEKKYAVYGMLKNLIERCRKLKLRLGQGEAQTLTDLTAYMTALISNYIFTGKYKRK